MEVIDLIKDADKVLIGLGKEWSLSENSKEQLSEGYHKLKEILDSKDYFIVTSNTDAWIYTAGFDFDRITAPCGNETWWQCEEACTKDIWEEEEVKDKICPHCGKELVPNTIRCENYVEEGYMITWKKYMTWLTSTINKKLVVLELGEGFKTPTVIRWPFEKTVYFNKKSKMFRVNKEYSQISEEIKERATAIAENSLEWIENIT